MTSFELICSSKANDVIPVYKYKSSKTGLKVVLAEVEGPVINGYFTLCTEANDDDGLPHTLEHLIFLGSEQYPFKGVLDLVANRCMASGTNAWTDTDHTCYTMTTAGSGGFLSLLPIYLDHILYPTLTDAAFLTEVHHITGDGDDGGVVYCEMEGRENSGESRAHLHLTRAIYPNCSYSAETGGIMQNLRETTTNKKVRDYHAEFYRPENLTIIVTGQVKAEEIFKALAPLEERIVAKGLKPPFKRPFEQALPSIEKSQNIKVVYPCDEVDNGLVHVGWRGPKCTSEHDTLTACSILMRYLSDTSVSPLQRDFVEVADPLASSVSYDIGENSESLLYFTFSNVPVEKIDSIHPKLKKLLENIASGGEKFDMERIKTILEKQILEAINSLESNPHDDIAFHVIGDVLYGYTDEDFKSRLNEKDCYTMLIGKDEQFWVNLIKKYLVESKYIVVRALPSIEEATKVAKDKLERVEQLRLDLGETGLRTKEEELMLAMEKNEIPPPKEILTEIDVPSTKGIQFHPLTIHRSGGIDGGPPGLSLNELPVFAEAYDLHSNFVYLMATLNTESLPTELRSYLILLLELLTESPIRRGDKLVPYEEIVKQLDADTISSGTRLGLESRSRFSCGPYSNTVCVMLQVEPRKYETGITLLSELLFNTEFTVDRIKVCAAKMVNGVAEAKRDGNSVVKDLLKAIYFNKDSNVQLNSMLKQQKFLTTLLERLDNPATASDVIADLNKTRDIITKTKNIALHLAADWQRLSNTGVDLNEPWTKILQPDGVVCRQPLTVIPDWKVMDINSSSLGKNVTGTVVGLGCIESAFLIQAAPAIDNFMDPDLPTLMLFLQYLTQVEGPLWASIRGQGLAYSYSINPRPHEGLIILFFYRATNVVGAYKEAKRIVEAQLEADSVWEETLLESAKSSLIFEIIDRERSVGDVVVQALLSSFKQVPTEYNRTLVKRLDDVTMEDLRRVGKAYVAPLFTHKARTAVVCPPDKASDVAAAFNQLGMNLINSPSLEESVLGSC